MDECGHPILTFSLRACGAAEGAVFVFDKMATQDYVLAGFGVFSANPEEERGIRSEICSQDTLVQKQEVLKTYLVMPSLM